MMFWKICLGLKEKGEDKSRGRPSLEEQRQFSEKGTADP